MKPLHLLFKKPPNYDEQWKIIHQYGRNISENSFKNFFLLESKRNNDLFTACTGKLSLRPPKTGIFDSFVDTNIIFSPFPDTFDISQETINLYLHVSPFLILDSSFREKNNELGNIVAFAYLNVEVLSLKEFLPQNISESFLKKLLEDAGIEIGSLEELSEEAKNFILNEFFRGRLEPFVKTGSLLAKVSPNKQIGFAVLTDFGAIDPSHVYDEMRDFVEDSQSDVDSFLGFIPKNWPINPNFPNDLKENLYPMSVLEDIRRVKNLTLQQWRKDVGNNQKKLWLDRLLKKSGHAPETSTAATFEFNDLDWQNIFQLEAIVEFYANFDDPWKKDTVPIFPGDPKYKTVDFLDLNGVQATVEGKKVTLDGNPDLSRVKATKKKGFLYDTIFLEKDQKRSNKLYRIEEVDVANNTITLDDSPDLTENSSVWRINLRPILVIIDPIGSRIQGKKAKISDPSKPKIIKLEDLPTKLIKRKKINPFDTIYLSSDRNTDKKPNRTYRILKVNETEKTVTLDDTPNLDGEESSWSIPAGISGELPNLNYRLGPIRKDQYDQYEALLFIVQNGKIYKKIRWSSYTSRERSGQQLSSIRGNRQYDFMSYRSGDAFKNYSIKVTDINANYDGVFEARFYFNEKVTADQATSKEELEKKGLGKTVIRLHYGSKYTSKKRQGTGSAGCLVSPLMTSFRDQLIELYQKEYKKIPWETNSGKKELNIIDDQVDKIRAKQLKASGKIWRDTTNKTKNTTQLKAKDWNNKLFGTLWLIRPDERPLELKEEE